MNVSLFVSGCEHVLRGGGGWLRASSVKGTWARCVRTVRPKMLFADGPKIAAAMRDMLATLGPGVCWIDVPVPVRGMKLVEHAPKARKCGERWTESLTRSPKALGTLGAVVQSNYSETQQTKTNLENVQDAVFGGLASCQLQCRRPRERRGRGRICRHGHGLMIDFI